MAIWFIGNVIKINHRMKEGYQNLCSKNKFIDEYPFKTDNQNLWTSEFSNDVFKSALSNKRFELKKMTEDGELIQVKTAVESWLNSIKRLQKKRTLLRVIKLEEKDDNMYELHIYRNGRNHGKVIHMKLNENDEKYIISNVKIIGVLTEYEMLFNNMNSYSRDTHLKYNKLEDMWIATQDERLTNEYVDLNELYNDLLSHSSLNS